MESPADRIADALERIVNILETGAHINIDHGHIEHIDHVDNVDHNHVEGDLNTHAKTW
ncbi:hypothetical protein [uncultured Mediterranean phage]|nr:hypothetical protein [uncultured Mediterranean phage]